MSLASRSLKFQKFHGTGNDFIMVNDFASNDQWSAYFRKNPELVARLCHRQFGIGADGLIIIRRPVMKFVTSLQDLLFEMLYFNSDGREASFCGNGSRCAVRFALSTRPSVVDNDEDGGDDASRPRVVQLKYLASDGIHAALFHEPKEVSIHFGDFDLKTSLRKLLSTSATSPDEYFINTGSPHHVRFTDKALDKPSAFADGRRIRHSYDAVGGSNVNFVSIAGDRRLLVRTFERGVEDLTLACGTGVVASALAYCVHSNINSASDEPLSIVVYVDGGQLTVKLKYRADSALASDVWLCGPAQHVFDGTIEI